MAFLADKSARRSPQLPDLVSPLREFIEAGGKRIRPVLALAGWHAAAGTEPTRAARHLAAALELFHAFALIHDDVMDRSATRRGHPTVHRAQAAACAPLPGSSPGRQKAIADRFGENAAILIGDLALVWADELFHRGHPTAEQLARMNPLLQVMRSELVLGQYLDLAAAASDPDVETALTVLRYKTAKYTIERPLQLGAVLASAAPGLLDALSAYAVPLGEAFQLRDDLLGVFGDPRETGKPVLDDLREGKATVLVALALQRARPAQADQLCRYLGCPTLTEDQAEVLRHTIEATGARDAVETMIEQRHRQALDALRTPLLLPQVTDTLRELANRAVKRHT
ncbi:polyprenyl synthetase family protein [Streptomyces wuyuanensis]|uniref:polyprenyl synthetase family protein n=1 Tax=Streptomyces wuyuanensis TaxID=1196353 RepID=UPI00343A7F0E